MQIKTVKLQDMVSKVIKGVGNNKLLPITGFIAITVKDGRITLTSTDNTHYLFVSDNVESEDFYVCIQADKFASLVSKMTSETTTLTITDNFLEVKGNGVYSIEIPLDENGQMVKYPNPLEDNDIGEKVGELTVAQIKNVLNVVKPCLDTSGDFVQYTNYFVGDCVMASDTYNVSTLNEQAFTTPRLISSEMMSLLDMATNTVDVFANGNKVTCVTPGLTVYGVILSDVSEFSVDELKAYINSKFSSMCKFSKAQFLQLLDRITLFVDALTDDNVVKVVFSENSLTVSSRKSSGVESIEYTESENPISYEIMVNVRYLQTQIKSQTSDVIEMWYGEPNAVKVVNGNNTTIIGLIEQ